jgi:hypothetical protein
VPAAIRRIHSKYLGEKTFPKEITAFEIREFFTLSAEDLRAIRLDSNKKSRLSLALQVGFLRMTGAALDTYEYIPRAVLECVATQLQVPAPMLATMRALSRRPMTRHRHQSWACRYLGISRLKAADEQPLFDALTAEMSVTVDREQLITRAHEIFWNHRWRIPNRRAVEHKVLPHCQSPKPPKRLIDQRLSPTRRTFELSWKRTFLLSPYTHTSHNIDYGELLKVRSGK